MSSEETLRRWRLILGRYAAQPLSQTQFSAGDWKLDQALEYLYGREYEGRGLASEAAAATSDLTGDILRAPVHRQLDGSKEPADDLCLIKGIGPKFAESSATTCLSRDSAST